MTRKLFTIAAVVSLLLGATSGYAWVATYRSTFVGTLAHNVDVGSRTGRIGYVVAGRGGVYLDDRVLRFHNDLDHRMDWLDRVGQGPQWSAEMRRGAAYPLGGDTVSFRWAGLSCGSEVRPARDVSVHERWAVVPLWLPVAASAVLPAWWVASFARGRRLAAAACRSRGRCPGCGYDLRATPERCPECGTTTG